MKGPRVIIIKFNGILKQKKKKNHLQKKRLLSTQVQKNVYIEIL